MIPLSRCIVMFAVLAATGATTASPLTAQCSDGTAPPCAQPPRDLPLDSNLLAVAPFDVLAPGLAVWREGLVDLLSRSLDGAGPITTVSPTVVVRRWSGRADPVSAQLLGRRTGARFVVIGQIVAAGRDSVRAAAALLDVGSGRSVGEVAFRDDATRMDRIGDSLAIGLLRQVGRARPVGVVRHASLGSASLPAVKAFLRGEQFYRIAAWDSVIAYDEQAVVLDSGFALARRRLGLARGWANVDNAPDDDLGHVSYQSLSTRDSLLLLASTLHRADNPAGEAAVLRAAAVRFPNDPEILCIRGDLLYHAGGAFGATWEEVERSFLGAIAQDSGFLPSYLHMPELALRRGDLPLARRYARAFTALDPTGVHQDPEAVGTRLVTMLLDSVRAGSPTTQQLLDTLAADPLIAARQTFRAWPDSQETAVRLARLAAASGHGPLTTLPRFLPSILAGALAFRGHLRESFEVTGTRYHPWFQDMFVEQALAGAVPPETANAEFTRLLQHDSAQRSVLPWWTRRGDTTSIIAFMAMRPLDAWAKAAVPAYLALARHDSATALAVFDALPDSLCWTCYRDRLTRVQLLVAAGRDNDAASLLERDIAMAGDAVGMPEVWWQLERGRVAQRLGRREQAAAAYRFVAAVWQNADPALQPYVQEARAALRALGAR